MKITLLRSFYLFVCALVVFTSCDIDGKENTEWEPANRLGITGSASVTITPTSTATPYYVQGFSTQKTYTWTVNGNSVTPTRGGEFVNVTFPAAGDYVIKVTDGTYEGTLNVTVK